MPKIVIKTSFILHTYRTNEWVVHILSLLANRTDKIDGFWYIVDKFWWTLKYIGLVSTIALMEDFKTVERLFPYKWCWISIKITFMKLNIVVRALTHTLQLPQSHREMPNVVILINAGAQVRKITRHRLLFYAWFLFSYWPYVHWWTGQTHFHSKKSPRIIYYDANEIEILWK